MNESISQKPKWLLSLFIFLITFIILGIPFTKWGMKGDDWGNLFHSQINSWKAFFNFFYEGSIEYFMAPSNSTPIPPSQQSGIGILWRPMSFVFYLPQVLLFKTCGYGYYLTIVALHSFNSAIIFNIFTYFLSVPLAFFGSLLFAFHPSLFNWLGWVSAETYFIELLLVLLTILLIKKYLDTNRLIFYVIACFIFLCHIFLKEQAVTLPFWLIGAIFLYKKYKMPNQQISSILISSLKAASGFLLICISYLFLRFWLYPPRADATAFHFKLNTVSILESLKIRFLDFVSYGADLLGLCIMPQKHQLIKGALIILLCSLLIFIFIKSKNKLYAAFLILSIPLLSWPAILIQYKPRYIYMALPLLLLFIVTGIEQFLTAISSKNIKNVLLVFMFSLIPINAIFLFKQLKIRESDLHIIRLALDDLVTNPQVKNRTLLLIGLPDPWFSIGTAQAIWFLTPKKQRNTIYYYAGTFSPFTQKYSISPVKITQINNGFRLTSVDENNFWFEKSTESILKTQEITFTKLKSNDEKVFEYSFVVSQELAQKNPLIVTWDYEKQKFKLL